MVYLPTYLSDDFKNRSVFLLGEATNRGLKEVRRDMLSRFSQFKYDVTSCMSSNPFQR